MIRSFAVDDRHPQEQGLKHRVEAIKGIAEPVVDDRHPQEQGLKHCSGGGDPGGGGMSTTVIHKNKD